MADDNTTLQNLMDATDVTILQPGETPRVDPLVMFNFSLLHNEFLVNFVLTNGTFR